MRAQRFPALEVQAKGSPGLSIGFTQHPTMSPTAVGNKGADAHYQYTTSFWENGKSLPTLLAQTFSRPCGYQHFSACRKRIIASIRTTTLLNPYGLIKYVRRRMSHDGYRRFFRHARCATVVTGREYQTSDAATGPRSAIPVYEKPGGGGAGGCMMCSARVIVRSFQRGRAAWQRWLEPCGNDSGGLSDPPTGHNS